MKLSVKVVFSANKAKKNRKIMVGSLQLPANIHQIRTPSPDNSTPKDKSLQKANF